MTPRRNYERIILEHFGAGACSFDASKDVTNRVIGALGHAQYGDFSACFDARMARLASLYTSESASFSHLLAAVNEVSSETNWDGAYAELVSIDFFNSDSNWITPPLALGITVPSADTMGSRFGKQFTNFDGCYDDPTLYFDVKVLSDKARSILHGIIRDALNRLGLSGVEVAPEYPLDIDYRLFEQNRRALFHELADSLHRAPELTTFRSTIVTDLSYRILRGRGVLQTVSTYDPFLHAKEHHMLLFKHADKFSTTAPCVIVFVVFPWFSEAVLSSGFPNDTFYRSFCRRFFCQYTSDRTPASSLLSKVNPALLLSDIPENLSGVLFLEDNSVTSRTYHEQNVTGFAYLNPNAIHKPGGWYKEHLLALGCSIDDFSWDNY